MERSKKSIVDAISLVVALAGLALTWLSIQPQGPCETAPWMCIPAAVVSGSTAADPVDGDKTHAKPGDAVS